MHRYVARGRHRPPRSEGFTLIELVLVVALIGVVGGLLVSKSGTAIYWREDGFVDSLRDTMEFLHHQAVVDGVFYRIDFDLKGRTYRVSTIGKLVGEGDGSASDLTSNPGQALAQESVGVLSLELAGFLSPSLGRDQVLGPPPSMPSLAEPRTYPSGFEIEEVQTPRGEATREGGDPYILFSPRGFSEFASLILVRSDGSIQTLLVNPFTGLTRLYDGRREFEWIYQ